jgi:hypothetical protein
LLDEVKLALNLRDPLDRRRQSQFADMLFESGKGVLAPGEMLGAGSVYSAALNKTRREIGRGDRTGNCVARKAFEAQKIVVIQPKRRKLTFAPEPAQKGHDL